MTVQSTEVLIGKTKLHLQTNGEGGDTVLFLHGSGGVPCWSPFFYSIGAGRRLLVPDHPGFGGSGDADWLRDMPDMAMFYLDVLDELDLHDVHLVGHSLGGWLAAEIAVRNGARIKSLSLISPAGIKIRGCPMGDVFIWSPEEAIRNLYFDPAFAERQLAQQPNSEQLDVMIRNRYTFTKLAWEPRAFNPSLEKWLHRITVPAQVIWGRQDKVLPAAYAGLWAKHLPQARVHLIDDCGHLPHVERASVAAQLVNDLLNEVTR
jgi:pimeloyl-ACP methyl ester carboxylesterase